MVLVPAKKNQTQVRSKLCNSFAAKIDKIINHALKMFALTVIIYFKIFYDI